MKPKKESEKILDEIISLHPFLERSDVRSMTDDGLYRMSKKLNEPRFLSYKIKRQLEEMEIREQRKKFLQNKK